MRRWYRHETGSTCHPATWERVWKRWYWWEIEEKGKERIWEERNVREREKGVYSGLDARMVHMNACYCPLDLAAYVTWIQQKTHTQKKAPHSLFLLHFHTPCVHKAVETPRSSICCLWQLIMIQHLRCSITNDSRHIHLTLMSQFVHIYHSDSSPTSHDETPQSNKHSLGITASCNFPENILLTSLFATCRECKLATCRQCNRLIIDSRHF